MYVERIEIYKPNLLVVTSEQKMAVLTEKKSKKMEKALRSYAFRATKCISKIIKI